MTRQWRIHGEEIDMRTHKTWHGAGILLGVMAIGLWTASAFGKPTGGRGARWGHPTDEMFLLQLVQGAGLTEAQQAQVRQIVASHRPKLETFRQQLRTAREQLAEKLYAPGPVKAEDLAPL